MEKFIKDIIKEYENTNLVKGRIYLFIDKIKDCLDEIQYKVNYTDFYENSDLYELVHQLQLHYIALEMLK